MNSDINKGQNEKSVHSFHPSAPLEPLLPTPPGEPCQNKMVHRDYGEFDKICRICLEDDDPDLMIAPCLCSGSSKWVHRDCLDLWRVQEEDRAFSKCTECLYEYKMQARPHWWKKRMTFCCLVSRDVLFMTFLWQVVLVLLAAFLYYVVDPHHDILRFYQGDCLVDASFWCNHALSLYYMCGVTTFFVLLGAWGCVRLCFNGCSFQRALSLEEPLEEPTYTTPTVTQQRAHAYRQQRRLRFSRRRGGYHHDCCRDDCCGPRYYYCPRIYYAGDDYCCCICPSDSDGCNCCDGCHMPHGSGSSSSSSGDGGFEALVVILLIVAIVLAVVRFVIGVVLAVMTRQRIIQLQLFVLQKRRLVQDFVVVDLSFEDASTLDTEKGVIPCRHPP